MRKWLGNWADRYLDFILKKFEMGHRSGPGFCNRRGSGHYQDFNRQRYAALVFQEQ